MRLPSVLLAALLLTPLAACAQEPPAPPEGESHTDEQYADDMAREHAGESPEPSGAADGAPAQEVVTREVTYATLDGQDVSGYLARPARGGETAPGLIVIHEWWGLNDNVRRMTDKLAGQGYQALAVDLYEGRAADSPERARELTQSVDEERATQNLRQAHRYLLGHGAKEVGVIGWCFGGGWSLRTALAMPEEIDAAVIYYGRLITDRERLTALDMPILGLFGAEDEGIPVSSVREFESALKDLGKNVEIHVYEGADHAFANPSGQRYQAEAAEDAWRQTVEFLAEHLK